jgi:hypothetical protein
MWALVKNNTIVKVIDKPEPITIDDVQHSSQVFTLWSDEEREAIGLYKIQENGSNKSNTFYSNSYFDTFENGIVTRTYINTPRSVEDVKSAMLSSINNTLFFLLQQTDWIVIREQEISEAKPSNLVTWRTNLRNKHAELETAINNASSVSELETIDIKNGWPEDPR